MTELEKVIVYCPEELCPGVPFYELQYQMETCSGRCWRCNQRSKFRTEAKISGECRHCKNGTICHSDVRTDRTCYYCDRPLIHIFNLILMKHSIRKQ